MMVHQRRFTLRIFLFAGFLVVILALVGFAGMMRLEETNTFCASCHTQPESEYVARMQSTPGDLAAFHQAEEKVNCIDCHSGPGLGGRVGAMLGGARNAVLYLSNTMIQPAHLRGPYPDGYCLKCHADIPRTQASEDDENHYHAFLTELKRTAPLQALFCVDCHAGHVLDGESGEAFLNRARVEVACDRCHNAMGEGGENEGEEGDND